MRLAAVISVYPARSLLKWINNSSDCILFKHRGRDKPLLKQIRCFLSTRGVNVPVKRVLLGPCSSVVLTGSHAECLLKRNTLFSLWTLLLSFWRMCRQLWRGQPTVWLCIQDTNKHLLGHHFIWSQHSWSQEEKNKFTSTFQNSRGDSLQTSSSNFF